MKAISQNTNKTRNYKSYRCYKSAQSGFTLLEVMVVMTIIAISIGVIGLSVNSLQIRNELQPFVDRLYQRMNILQQEAVLTQTEIGFSFYENKIEVLGYNFNSANKIWKVKKTIKIPKYIKLSVRILEPDIFYSNLADSSDTNKVNFYNNNNSPEIIMASGGQITPFKIIITHPDEEYTYALGGEFSGELSLEMSN